MITTCFFCNKKVNSPAKLIAKRLIACEECDQILSKGNTLITVCTSPMFENQEPLVRCKSGDNISDLYPMGEWASYSDYTIRTFFNKEAAEKIIDQKYGLISAEISNQIHEIYTKVKVPKEAEEKAI